MKVLDILNTDFTIEVCFEDTKSLKSWWFVGIYASTKEEIRKEQWGMIAERKKYWGNDRY